MSVDRKTDHDIDPKTALAPYVGANKERQEQRVRRDFWAKLKKAGRNLPFAEEAVAAFYCATDSRTPASARALLFAALAYFIAPIDFVPDVLALIGFGDDMAVLMSVFAILKTNITDEHRAKARAALDDVDAA
ncbi:MAG: YkvA family protein [Notoacmeibacter sp.]